MNAVLQLAAIFTAIVFGLTALCAFLICTEKVCSEAFGALNVKLRWRNRTPVREERARFDARVLASFTPVSDEAEQMVRQAMARVPPVPLRVVPNTTEREMRIEVR